MESVADFKLAFDDFIVVDAGDVPLGEFLETVEFVSVLAGLAECAGGVDEGVGFLYGVVRLNLGFQIEIGGGEEFAPVFLFPSGGERIQCGFVVGGNGQNGESGEKRK